MPLGQPSNEYLGAIREGLAGSITEGASYLGARTRNSVGDNQRFLPRAKRGPQWSGNLQRGSFSGYPAVRLPQSLSPVEGARSFLATVRADGKEARAWVDFVLESTDEAQVGSALARQLGLAAGIVVEGVVALGAIHTPSRLSGRLEDISVSDAIQVSQEDALASSRWALAVTPWVSAPVRVVARPHVSSGNVRVAYALRALLGTQKGDPFALEPIEPTLPRGLRARVRTGFRMVGESVLGAPTVALRATEGLVGDDGKMIARIDPTALDFLGVQAGHEAVLSWADRAVIVRVLLQTSETREVMIAQLAESTGMQLRDSVGDPKVRSRTPEHLRVWVSSSVRHALGIPPDTVVRLRRSIPHALVRGASQATVPAIGLVIAAATLDLPWWIWLCSSIIIIALVGGPLRLKQR